MNPPVSREPPSPTSESISAAIRRYQACCGLTGKSPFCAMVETLINRHSGETFVNKSFFDALCLVNGMIAESLFSVRILSEGYNSEFWRALKPPLEQASNHMRRTGGKIRIIALNPSPDCTTELSSLSEPLEGVLEVVRAASNQPVSRFVVCDSKMLRLEDPYGPIDGDGTPSTAIRAKVNFRDSESSKRQERIFDSIWTRLSE